MAVTKDDINEALCGADNRLDIDDWHRMVEQYPYCEIFLWHYLRALYRGDDVSFDGELQRLGVRLGDRHAFYSFMTRQPLSQPLFTYNTAATDYFASKGHEDVSLTELARRLREARLSAKGACEGSFCTPEPKKNDIFATPESPSEGASGSSKAVIDHSNTVNEPSDVPSVQESDTVQNTESLQLIRAQIASLVAQKKYCEALAILKRENFANSKKNAYFAVQIRYLETIINNK